MASHYNYRHCYKCTGTWTQSISAIRYCARARLQYCEKTRNMGLYKSMNLYLLVLLLCVIFADNVRGQTARNIINNTSLDIPDDTNSTDNSTRDKVKVDFVTIIECARNTETLGPILDIMIIVVQYTCQLMPPFNYICANYNKFIDYLATLIDLYNIYKPELQLLLFPFAQLHFFAY